MDPHTRHLQLTRQYGDGVFSPSSNRGLAKLEKKHPHDWDEIVWRETPPGSFSPTTTLDEALVSDLFVAAMPRHSDDRKRIERYRRLAGHLQEHGEGITFSELDESGLSSLLRRLVDAGLYAEPAQRAVSIVRRLALAWARALGVEPQVEDRPRGGGRRIGARRGRPVPPPLEVAELLQRGDHEVAQLVALVVGGGLLEQEALAVRVGDLGEGGLVLVCDHQAERVVREVQLPAWTTGLLPTTRDRATRAASGFLFPHRLDPQRHRLSFGPKLRRLSQPNRPVTASGLRRLHQAVLGAAGLPRELVRGSWRARSGRRPWWEGYVRLQRDWTTLVHPPVRLPEHLRVPRRSGATQALEADLGSRRRATRLNLPAAVHPQAPVPAQAAPLPRAPNPRRGRAKEPGHGSGNESHARTGPRAQSTTAVPSPPRRKRLGVPPPEPEPPAAITALDSRLRSLEAGEKKARQERKTILDAVRQSARSGPSQHGNPAVPFFAGAATGVGLAVLLQHPELLQRLPLDPKRLAQVADELAREAEGLTEPLIPPPQFSYIDFDVPGLTD